MSRVYGRSIKSGKRFIVDNGGVSIAEAGNISTADNITVIEPPERSAVELIKRKPMVNDTNDLMALIQPTKPELVNLQDTTVDEAEKAIKDFHDLPLDSCAQVVGTPVKLESTVEEFVAAPAVTVVAPAETVVAPSETVKELVIPVVAEEPKMIPETKTLPEWAQNVGKEQNENKNKRRK